MPSVKFTQSILKQLTSSDEKIGKTEYYDQSTRNLVLQGKSWYIRYSIKNKGKKRKIGLYPHTSLEEARNIVRAHMVSIVKGIDPFEQPKVSTRFDEFLDLWYESKAKSNKSKVYLDACKRYVGYILDSGLGKRDITTIKYPDLESFLNGYISTPYAHNRLRSALTSIFRYAVRHELILRSPCTDLPRLPESARHDVFTTDEYNRIVAACESMDSPTAKCILLIALTGCRPSEARSARTDNFDLEKGFWVREASQTKQKRLQKVIISKSVVSLVKSLGYSTTYSGYLFPSESDSGHIEELRKTWYAILKLANIKYGYIYMLRKYFASELIRKGASVKQLQEIMAWEDAHTPLKYYIKVDESDCRSLLEEG